MLTNSHSLALCCSLSTNSHVLAELKSIHTLAQARGQGAGEQLLRGLIHLVREMSYRRMGLEMGTTELFQPAQRLYAALGFQECAPFGGDSIDPLSICMTLEL